MTEQTEDIASLRKQLSAYANDDSEESKQKIQQIKASLEKAEEDLKDTEYDHYIDAQKELLDDLYSQYEETLNARLDNIDLLMKDMITKINENASTIATTLNAEATNVGTKLTDHMSSIWSEAGPAISGYMGTFLGPESNVNKTISKISVDVANMVAALNAEASGSGNGSSGNAVVDAVKNKIEKTINGLDSSKNNTKPVLGVNGHGTTPGNGRTQKITVKNLPNKNNQKDQNGDRVHTANVYVHDFFVSKPYSGKKVKSERLESLTKMLQFYDISTAKNDLKKYYTGMKLASKYGEYKGTDKQKNAMLNWMTEKGYKRGSHSILEDQLAWTNENTPETIIRKSDGAILTPLKAGDMVLNTAAHENIWDMAADPTKFISDHFMGTVPAATTVNNSNEMNYNGDCNVNISLPNVESYNDFVRKMQHDNNLEKMMQSMTVSRTSGAGPMKKYRY